MKVLKEIKPNVYKDIEDYFQNRSKEIIGAKKKMNY